MSDFLRREVAAGTLPGAVILVERNGHRALFEAIGFADRSAQRAMQLDSIFRVASMTKPVTSVAALMLQERGDMLLTDPLARFLPELRALTVGLETTGADGVHQLEQRRARGLITIHDLLRHTAGFTYGNLGDSLVQRRYREAAVLDWQQSNAEMVAKLAQLPLAHQPGGTFEYGMSTDVLGRVIEVVSGMGLDAYFRSFLTAPLDMPDTAFTLSAAQSARLAQPQYDVGARVPRLPDPHDIRWHSGGGGLFSTAPDYANFCRMLLNGGVLGTVRVLSRKTIALMTSNHLPAGCAYGPHTADLGPGAPLPRLGQGYGLGVGVRIAAGLSPVPGSVGDYYWGGITGPNFWIDPAENLFCILMLQELDPARRMRYRSLLRALVYQALH